MKENRRKNDKHNWGKHIIGGSITLFCLTIFCYQVNFTEAIKALTHFHWLYLIPALLSLAVGYAFRIMRWSMMLKSTGACATFHQCSAPFLGSIALNNVLPLRLGDVVRALIFPTSMGISKTTATSSLVIERLMDLMSLLLSLMLGLLVVHLSIIPIALKTLAIFLAIIGGVLLTLGILFSGALSQFFLHLAETSRKRLNKLYVTMAGLLLNVNRMSQPRLVMLMMMISMLVWVGEAGCFYFVLLGVGINSSFLVALLVMAVATLSTLVPSSPGYVGPFHLAAFMAISLVGGTSSQAGTYAVIVHLVLWIPTTCVGLLAIWLHPELFRSVVGRKSGTEDAQIKEVEVYD